MRINLLLEATLEMPRTKEVRTRLFLILGMRKRSPRRARMRNEQAMPHLRGILWIM